MKNFKNSFHRLKERFGFSFYTKPQTYAVQYRTVIKNLIPENNSVAVVLPIPLDTEYQKLQSTPIFAPEPSAIKRDSKFGNQYAVWEIGFQPNAAHEVAEKFAVSVLPRKSVLQEKFLLQDYVASMVTGDYASYLESNKYVQAEDSLMKKLADDIAKNTKDVYQIISRFNEYVISNLQYGNPIPGLYSAKDAIDKKTVDCGGFDTLLATLCIAKGIPARIVSGFWSGYKKNEMHAWVEILLPNSEWLPADPSVEYLWRQGRTSKHAGLGFLYSDRIALSVGCDIPVEIKSEARHVAILQNPIVFAEHGADSISIKAEFLTTRQ